jgi:HAD superfamily hydrolase (TIGR01509 family)
MSGLRAVLFDMDGLLVDSERIWLEVEAEVFEWLGGTWRQEHHDALVGCSVERSVAYMLARTGSAAAPEEAARRLMAGMIERLRDGVPFLPGAKDLLAEVRESGLPTALVSSTYREVMEHTLDSIGREFFTITVAGDEVTRTKPDPEPYETAARRLGVEPRRCAVLEDSPSGVASAQAAGCAVVAVPSVASVPAAPRRLVVGSLREIDLATLRTLVDGVMPGD